MLSLGWHLHWESWASECLPVVLQKCYQLFPLTAQVGQADGQVSGKGQRVGVMSNNTFIKGLRDSTSFTKYQEASRRLGGHAWGLGIYVDEPITVHKYWLFHHTMQLPDLNLSDSKYEIVFPHQAQILPHPLSTSPLQLPDQPHLEEDQALGQQADRRRWQGCGERRNPWV